MEELSLPELEATRQKLLKLYHTKKEELEFAMDDMEVYFIEQELDKFRTKIKECKAIMEELQAREASGNEEA